MDIEWALKTYTFSLVNLTKSSRYRKLNFIWISTPNADRNSGSNIAKCSENDAVGWLAKTYM